MKQTEHSPLGFYTIGIAALFLAGFFLLVVFGAKSYRNTVGGQEENMRTRALLSYLATTVHANDAYAAVRINEGPEGQVLVVPDSESDYALRIYLYEGNLVEDFAAEGSPLAPESAQVIGKTASFFVEERDKRVLFISTDVGHILLHLRSEGGAA